MESLSFGNLLKSSGAALSRSAAVSLALACMWLMLSAGQASAVPAGYNLVFNENFNGDELSDTMFRYAWTGYSGSSNTTDAVSVGDGSMTMKVYSTGTGGGVEHWGGCVSTNETYSYTYGYTEARIKFNNSQGCCMAYWLEADAMFTDPPGEANDGIEVDIVEQRHTDSGNNNIENMFHLQLHAEGYGDDHYQHGPSTQPTVASLEDTWHVIGCEWDADGYRFYCDGQVKWSYFPDWWDDFTNGEFCSNGPEWLLFSTDPSGGWCGDLLASYGSLESSTTTMEVDYCRVYQKTPMFWKQGDGGTGTWNTGTANWSYSDGGAAEVYDNNEEVYFRGTAGTVTISGFTPGVTGMHFESDGYTVTGGSINMLRSDICVKPDVTATIASTLTGSKGLTLRGEDATLVLTGNNTYTGLTKIKTGSVLNIRHANALGNTSDGTVVSNYSALQIQGGITTANEPLLLSGSGISWDGSLRNMSGNNTYAGLVTLASDVRIRVDADSLTLSNAGTITGDGYDMMILGPGDMTINSVIGTGAGGLEKNSTGSLTLTRANTYTGTTTVAHGTLIYGTNNVIASGNLIVGNESWGEGAVNMGAYSDTVGAVTLITGSINGTGTLTSTSGFNLQQGTADVVLAGSVGLTKTGVGTATLMKANTYTGTTTVSAGTLAYGINNAIASGVVDVDGGTLNMGAYSDTISALDLHSGTITGTGTLTSTGAAIETWSGTANVVLAGNVGLYKNGAGTVTLSKANTYAYDTTIYDGTLSYGISNAIASGDVYVNGGTLAMNAYSDTVGHVSLIDGAITGTGTLYSTDGFTLTEGTVSARLAGSVGATKTGAGTVTLNRTNTYSGTTAITGGTLAYGINNAIYSGPLTISGNGTLALGSYSDTISSVTISAGNITGTGTLTSTSNYTINGYGTVSANLAGSVGLNKNGTGNTMVLSGNNTYTGTTNINGGSIRIQHANALGSIGSGTVVHSTGGSLELAGGIITANEPLTLSGQGYYNCGALRNYSDNNTYSGLITLGADARITSVGGTLTLGNTGTITGSGYYLTFDGAGNTVVNSHIGTGTGRVYKSGTGMTTLNASSTYGGTTYLQAGVLRIQHADALGTTVGGISVTAGATLQVTGGITTAAERMTLRGNGVSNSGGLRNISGNNTYAGLITLGADSRINSDNGQLYISNNGTITGSGYDLTFGGNGDIAVASHIGTGSGTVTKDGSGSLYLLTSNTYTGATNINAGSVTVQNATGLGTNAAGTTVANGATLKLQNSNTYTESFVLNGSGEGNNGALRNLGGNNTITGAVTFNFVGARINSDSGTLTFNSGTDMTGTSNLSFGGAGDIVVHTDIAIGNGKVYKDGSGTARLTGSNTYTDVTNIDGGTLELVGMYAHNPVLSYGGCDIEQGRLVLENPYSVNTVISLIEASYDGGDWDSGQFLCSTADADHGLGWINDSGDITVAYTVYGDVDLDGDVDDDDVDIVEGNLYTAGDWADGDVNYDGYVNYTDLDIVNDNYGMTQSFKLEIDPVPEPSTLILLAVAGIVGAAAYGRRRRARS